MNIFNVWTGFLSLNFVPRVHLCIFGDAIYGYKLMPQLSHLSGRGPFSQIKNCHFIFVFYYFCILQFSSDYNSYFVNRTALQFNILPVSGSYIKHFCGKLQKIIVNLINFSEFNLFIFVIYANHCFFRILGDGIIPTSAAIFIYNSAVDIARSFQNVSGCSLLRVVT